MTNKKSMPVILTILALLMAVITTSGCLANTKTDSTTDSMVSESKTIPASDIEKIEVFHFHKTRQCYSCITIGKYAEETVNLYFPDELKNGKLVFGHINIDLPENKETVEIYGATGSSLWIGVYNKDGFFSKEENTNVWYKISNRLEFLNYLKQILEQKLGGN